MTRQFSDGIEGQPGAAPESTLASGIAAGATSCAVAAGHGGRFPATGPFSLRFEDAADPTHFEVVSCSARSTDTLTHGATTYAWDPGDKVIHIISKQDLDDIYTQLAAKQALSAYDAKGDLLVGTAADTSGKLTVGANGSIPVADSGATTGIAWRTPATATVATTETTTSTSLTDLATSGPAVTVTTGTMALVFVSAAFKNSGAGSSRLGVAVSGASTVAASDIALGGYNDEFWKFGTVKLFTGLTAGSNTFTMKYRVGSGTGTFEERVITVVPL